MLLLDTGLFKDIPYGVSHGVEKELQIAFHHPQLFKSFALFTL
jgi:hypothetical protein